MDIRTHRTRELLRSALEQLLDEKSLEDISVSEICELSTVRRATFYRHFEDKYAFFEWYLQTITERFLFELGEESDCTELRTYAELMHRKLIGFVHTHKSMMRHSLGKTDLLDAVIRQIADGIAQRISVYAVRRGASLPASPEFISLYYSGGMMLTLRWWISEDMPCSEDELVEQSTDFLMSYLENAAVS